MTIPYSEKVRELAHEILMEAETLYPIDKSRIYAAGFSYGGFMANLLGNKRPDVYAAVAPCGVPISNGFCEKAIGPEPQLPFDGISRAQQMGVYMPVINVAGNLDGDRFPLYDYKQAIAGPPRMEDLVEGINHWARVNHASEIEVAAVKALKGRGDVSEEEKNMGIPLTSDCRRTVVADGIVNYIADLKSEDGVCRIRIMCEMNMPHWPTPELSRQVFEFFSHFRRDPKTKESIYCE